MMLSKRPRYYRKYFDRTFLVSGSLSTLPKQVVSGKFSVPKTQQYHEVNDEIVQKILEDLRSSERNGNHALILDDVIKDIKNSTTLSHVFLNRRHITNSADKEGCGGLSVFIISQVYNLLPLQFRKVCYSLCEVLNSFAGQACCTVILFKTENRKELQVR